MPPLIDSETILQTTAVNGKHAYSNAAELRLAHSALLAREADAEGDAAFWLDVADLIEAGRATGAVIDGAEERLDAQRLLSYWSATFLRERREAKKSVLAPFDPARVPELPDDLCPYVGLDAFQEEERD